MMEDNTYTGKLQKKIDKLREDMSAISAAKTFDQDPRGALLVDYIRNEVNELFERLTTGNLLERDEYIRVHTAMIVYRGMLRAIANKANDEQRVNQEMKDATDKLKAAKSA